MPKTVFSRKLQEIKDNFSDCRTNDRAEILGTKKNKQ